MLEPAHADDHPPWVQVQVTSGAEVASLRLQDNGQVVASGAVNGDVAIMQLSKGLAELQPNEKTAMLSVSAPPCKDYETPISAMQVELM